MRHENLKITFPDKLREDEIIFLISCLNYKKRTSYKLSFESISSASKYYSTFFGGDEIEILNAFDLLKNKNLITYNVDDSTWELTNIGVNLALDVWTEFFKTNYASRLLNGSYSKAYAELCEFVYGSALIRFNMLNNIQLEYFIKSINFEIQIALDLGCGTGQITSFIAQNMSIPIIGVDFSEDALLFAKKKINNNNVFYTIADLNNFSFKKNSFDFIYSIDSIGFISNIDHFLTTIKNILKDTGKFFVFISFIDKNGDVKLKENGYLDFNFSLINHDFQFQAYDFTSQEILIWEKYRQILPKLQHDFYKEDRMTLWKSLNTESERLLGFFDKKIRKRYFYIITK